MKLIARATTRIYGTTNSWSLAPSRGNVIESHECKVDLEIQGDEVHGFHLIMSPNGFFTADNWYQSKEEAIAAGLDLFGVAQNKWSVSQP